MKKYLTLAVFLCCLAARGTATAFADEASDIAAMSKKTDTIIKTQQDILKQLDDIKAELQIIKVRSSRG